MSLDNGKIQAILRNVGHFSALDEQQLAELAAATRPVRLGENENLFQHGQPAEDFFLVLSGQIKLFRLSEGGDEKVIEIITPGRLFAEAVMFMERQVYPVNAQAVQATELLAISSRVFTRILRESVDTCFRVMGVMSQRLHRHLNEIDSLTLHNATYRLVSYLLNEAAHSNRDQPSLQLNTPKHVVASRLSIQPETLSRILSRLSKQNLIEVRGSHIEVLDHDGLLELVAGQI
jgi:CRP/FNR family transcriptional regulator, dissimilatory nitrate respiration regulator